MIRSNSLLAGIGLILAAIGLSAYAARQIPIINGPIAQSTSEASASALVERDSNADARAARWTASTALVSEGGLKAEYDAKTSNYTVTEAEYLVAFNATSGDLVATLPAAASSDGQIVVIKKTDSSINSVTVDGNSAETIDGVASLFLTLQYETMTLQCDAVGWHVASRFVPRLTRALSATETMTGAASVLLVTAAADVTITGPPAAEWIGKSIWIKKVDAGGGDAILDPNASETADGAATTTTTIDTQYEVREYQSDGTNWYVVSASSPG